MEQLANLPPKSLEECIACFRKNRDVCELEIRLGTVSQSRFVPGVSKDVFEQLERDLTDAPGLTSDQRWTDVLDYHYVCKDNPVRTRVTYDSGEMDLKKVHISKQNHEQFVFCRTDDGDEACKICRSLEIPVEPPNTCLPTYVRIKQRKVFVDMRQTNAVWSYELSRTWSANGRGAAEHLQHTAEPTYEVELELVDEDGTYTASRTDREVAMSLLMKATMLLGENPTSSLCLHVHDNHGNESSSKRRRKK